MKKILKKFLDLFNVKLIIANRKHELLKLGVSNSNADILNNGETIVLKDFGITLNFTQQQYILRGLGLMYNLKAKYNARFNISGEAIFSVELQGLTMQVQTYEELFILNEIYTNGVYNLITNKPYHVIDVGMNVGLTSLYFAQRAECISVTSFEPFKPTYQQALVNLALNPGVKNKVEAYNFGLGKTDEMLKVTYDTTMKGNMGINGIPQYLSDQVQQVLTEEITIKNTGAVLSPILNKLKTNDSHIVLKMDCEGSEYDIFESLATNNLLSYFNHVIVEWHVKGPQQIIGYLEQAGFTLFSFEPHSEVAGMIYAFKL